MFKKIVGFNALVILFIFQSHNVLSQIQSNGTGGGNWTDGATWQGGIAPVSGDNVIILSGDAVTLNASRDIQNLTINNGGALSQNDNRVLTLTGNLINNGTFTSNENNGNRDVILMTGVGSTLDGTGIFDMDDDGTLEFQSAVTILASANLTFIGTQEPQVSINNNVTITNNGTVTIAEDLVGGNGNSTWINAANATLNVGDDLLATGILTANANGNTVNYNGTSDDNIKTPTGSEYWNLIVSGTQIKTVQAPLTIKNDISISSTLNPNGHNLTVEGNWLNTGIFQEGSVTVTFNGTGTQSITNATDEVFGDLTVNKSNATLTVNANVQVTGTLDITNCIIDMGSNTLTLGSSTAATGTLNSSTATIIGKFERWINATGVATLFPLGTSADYNPLEITFNNLTGGSLIGEFIPSNPGSINNPPLDDGGVNINNTYLEGYWTLSRANSLTSSDYDLSLNGNGFNSFTVTDNTRILARTSAAGDWQLDGSHVSAGFSFPVARRDNMSILSGEYTLAENNSCSFPTTSAISGTPDVCINTTGEVYTASGTTGSTFSWEVIGGTIVGGSGTGTALDPSTRSGVNLTNVTVDWGGTGGAGEVKVTEDNSGVGGCGPGEAKTLAITIHPVVTSAITGISSVPAGQTGVTYSVTNTSGYTYTWSVTGGPGNAIVSGQNTNTVTVDWGTTTGDFTLSVVASEASACSPSQQATQVDLTVSIVDVIESNGTGGGVWNDAATWIGGIIPAAGNNVRIQTGDLVTLNVSPTINNFEIESGGTLSQNDNRVLTLTGNLINNGTFTSNENNGNRDVILMTGTGSTLDGTGTFDMDDDGTLEFQTSVTILSSANLTFTGTQEPQVRVDNDVIVTNNGTVTITQDLTGGNGNSTWINGANSTLIIGDDLLDTGVLIANASGNTVNYNGDTNDNIKTPSGNEFWNLGIVGTQIMTAQANLTMLGNLTIASTFNPNGNTITVGGDWINSGSFQEGTSTVIFNGTASQNLTSATDEIFNNLTVAKNGTTLTLGNNVQVVATLDIDNCFINTGSNTLTLGSSTAATGTLNSSTATIIGKFERWINATGVATLFPLGTSADYNPLEITFNNLTGGSLIGEFIPSNPGSINNPPLDDGGVNINNTYLEGYWTLSRANSLTSSDYDLSLNGNGFNSFTVTDNTRILARTSAAGDWQLDGSHVSVGFSFPVARRDNMSILSGEYTLAENNSCSFPTTSAVSGTPDVCINTTGEVYTASGTTGSTFSWEVIGGTIVGGSGTGTALDPSTRSGVNLTNVTVDWGSTGGAGEVKVTEDNSGVGGCGPGEAKTLAITIHPVATSAITGISSVPAGQTGVTYSVTNTSGYTYTWSVTGGPGNAIVSGQNTNTVTVDWGTTTGDFTLSVVASEASACSPSQQATQVDLTVSIVDVIESNGTGGGVWNDAATWIGGIIPAAGNNVRIQTGDLVTLNVSPTINNFEIESGGTLSQNDNRVLTLTGNLINNGTFTSNENNGNRDVILMTGVGSTLDGTGTFDMDDDGTLEFQTSVTILSSANLTFTGTQEPQVRVDNDVIVTNNGTVTITQDLTGGNGNSTWINGANSTLIIGDDLLDTGVLIANASGNTVNYNGDTNDNIKTPSGNEFWNLGIVGTQIMTAQANLTMLGNLTIASTFNPNGNTITVGGDWINTGSFQEGTSTVIFNGTAGQNLTSATDEIFNNLTVAKNGTTLTLGNNVQVVAALDIDNCFIDVQSNVLTLGSGISQLGTLTRAAPATIIGKFERWVNTGNQNNLLFPVGTGTNYNPVVVTFNNLNAGSMTAEFISENPGTLNSPPLDDNSFDLNNTYTEGYWSLTRANSLSSSDYDLQLTANGFTSFTPSSDTRIVTRLNGSSNWSVNGTHDGTGFVSPVIKRTNMTLLSAQYTIAENDNCSLPTTSAITGDDNVCINETGVSYSVTGTTGSTFTWEVTGGTIQGSDSGVNLTGITVDWGASGGTGEVRVTEDNTAVGGCGAGVPVTRSITINPVPTSAISGNMTAIIDQTGVTYTITGNAGYTYDWDITGGTITAPADPDNDATGMITVTWGNTPGSGQISVVATEGAECMTPQSTAAVSLDVTLLDVIESNGSGGGVWNNAATWAGGIIPAAGNNVRIQTGDLVTLNVSPTINNFEIESGATLFQNDNRVLTLTGNLTNNGTFTSNENNGNRDVIIMTGTGSTLDGTGTFDMDDDGTLEFQTAVTIQSGANLTFTGTQEPQVRVDNDVIVTNNGTVTIAQDLVGGNGNSTWINGANSTLIIGDDLLDTGVLIANASGNTVNYNGDTNDNIKTPSGNEFWNLGIVGTQIMTAQANLTMLGDLTISSTFNPNGNTITVGGDWINTGSFQEGTSTVNFNGSSSQTISSTTAEDFFNLTMNKTGGTLTTSNHLTVSSILSLEAGALDMGANRITLGTSTASLGTLSHTAPARIIGEFERWVNTGNQTGLELPVGTSSDLREAVLTFNNLTAGSIVATFISGDPGSNGLSLDDNGTTVFNTFHEGYWKLTTANGLISTDYDADLTAGGFTSFDISTSRVLTRIASGPWTADGTHVATVGDVAKRTNITTLSSELALGDVINCSVPATASITGDVSVCINESAVTYAAIGGLAGSTYTWTVTGGTIDGGTNTGVGLTSINVTWGSIGGSGQVTVVENNNYDPVFGCGPGPAITLDVTINPVATSAISGNTTAIIDQTGVTYSVTGNAGYTYDWDITGGTITAPADPDNDATGMITVTWGNTPGSGQISVFATEGAECTTPQSTAAVSLDVTLLDVIESNGSGGGVWNNAATWAGGIIPAAGNNVRIQTGDLVTLNVSPTINNFEIEGGATLFQNDNRVLTLTGNLTNNGTFTSNENNGNRDVIIMTGTGSTLDGTGTFDMDDDGTLEFQTAVTIQSGANLTFTGTQEPQVRVDNDVIVTNNGTVTITQDLTGGNGNSTWINAANSTLIIGDDLLATGVLIANASGNTVNYNGDTNDNIKTPSGNEFWNLGIVGTQIMTAQANLTMLGDLTISSTFNPNGNTITVGGDWINTGSFQEGTSTVIFNGTADQNVTSASTALFYNLQNAKSSGSLLLNGNAQVTNQLTMQEGNIDVLSNTLTLGTNAITEGTLSHTSGTIVGKFERWVNSAAGFLFPVGSNSDYRPATISFDGLSAGGSLVAEFLSVSPGTQGLPFDDAGYTVENTFSEGYWSITNPNTITFTTYDIDLTGNGFVSFPISADTRLVSRATNASDWSSNGIHVNTSGTTAQRDNIAALPLEFAFGDDTNCTPPATSAISRAVAGTNCTDQTGVVYQVTNTPGSTYNWTVAGGAITGGQGENAITITWGSTGGTYTISVTEDNSGAGGCGIGTAVNLDVEVNPLPTGSITGDASVAAGTTGETYSVTARPNYTYNWSISGGTITSTNPSATGSVTVDWGAAGTGNLSVIATSDDCSLNASEVSLPVDIFPVIESNGSGGGNWNAGSSWAGGVVPQPTNSVRIINNDVIVLNGSESIDNIIITTNATLRQNDNRVLTITGDFTNDGLFDSNENNGNRDVLLITGSGSTLDGTGTFDMGDDGTLEFQTATTISSGANLTFSGTQQPQVRIDNDVIVTNNGAVTIGQDLIGGNANATWINAANATLTVGDDLLATGQLTASATGNTVAYNGTTDDNIKTTTNGQYYNLTVSGSGTESVQSNLEILNNLTISSGVLNSNGNNLTVGGNWLNTSSFTEGTQTVTFNGTADQTVTNASTETFHTLTVNKNGGSLVLVNDVDVTNTLNLTLGILNTQTNGVQLTLGTNVPSEGTLNRTSGYVFGDFRRWINAASTGTEFLFPVGSASRYLPLEITFDAITTGGSVTASFTSTSPGNTGLPIINDGGSGIDISNAFTEGFWTLTNADGFATTQYDTDITGNGFTSFSFDPSGDTRVLVRPNGMTNWTSPIPGSHVAGTGEEVQRDNVTTAFPIDLGIGDITNCPTISTSPISGDTEVCTLEGPLAYSVTNTVGSTYIWTVTGGTIQESGSGSYTAMDNDINITWSATGGERTVQVIEEINCGGTPVQGSPVTLNVNVNPIPAGSITGSVNLLQGAIGEAYSIVNRSGYRYNWSTSDGTIVGSNTNSSVTVDWTTLNPTGTLTLTVTYDNAVAECGAPTTPEVINLPVTFFSTFETTSSGDFHQNTTWVCNCVPNANADVVIKSGHTLSLIDNSISLGDLEIENGASLNMAGFQLTLNRDLIFNGDLNGNGTLQLRGNNTNISGTGQKANGTWQFLDNNKNILAGSNLTLGGSNIIGSGVTLTNNGSITFEGDLSGNASSSTFINAANSSIDIKAGILTTGRLEANANNNTVIYSGTGAQEIKIPSGSPSGYYNLQLLGSGNKNVNSNLAVANDLTINGGTLVGNTFNIDVGGDWDNQSDSYTQGTSTVTFSGSGLQSLTNTNNSETFYNLEIDNSSNGQGLTFATNNVVNVTNQLILTDGFISPTSTERLILGSAASVNLNASGGQENSYVKGVITHTVAATGPTAKIFPVGDNDGYRRADITVTHDNTSSTEYTGEYITANANTLNSSSGLPDLVEDIKDVSQQGYWRISKAAGANLTTATATFHYTSADAVSDFNNLIIAKADDENTAWTKEGEGGTGNIAGTITSNSFTSFSIFSLGNNNSGSNPLPVELLSFDATLEDGQVLLEWKTASEINNDFFEIQRSENGNDWTVIGEIDGNGTSNEIISYSFIDEDPIFGKSFYRLKQVDFDGQFEYSNVVSIDNVFVGNRMQVNLFPNPTSANNINLRLTTANKKNKINIRMVGSMGDIYYSESFEPTAFDKDMNIRIGKTMTGGIYILIIEQAGKVFKKKVIIY